MALFIIIAVLLLFTGCPTGNDGVSALGINKLGIFVDVSYSGGDSDGSSLKPYTTISEGIVSAESIGYESVYVACGIYSVAEPIELTKGVSLYGGFNSVNWKRSGWLTTVGRENYLTKIIYAGTDEGSSSSPSKTFYAGSTITEKTIIEGFTIEGKVGGEYSSAILNNGGSPIIRYNTISGGSGGVSSSGIYISSSSSPYIYNNIITAENGTAQYGINNISNSVPRVNNNCIYVALTDSGTVYSGSDGNLSIDPVIDFTKDIDMDGWSDWHDSYTISDAAITDGGMDLSADFTTDKNGLTRTTPWSMGAFEID